MLKLENRVIGIGLFERQLIRSLLQSDNCTLLKLLSACGNKLFIFTNSANMHLIKRTINENGLQNIKIIGFSPPNLNPVNRFLQLLLRWSEPSTGTQRMAHREYEEGRISKVGLVLRLVLWKAFAKSRYYKRTLRKLFQVCYVVLTPKDAYRGLPELDFLYLTSITNFEDEIHLGIYYRSLDTFVIGSTRSWDNLTTKGVFPFEPDLFFANSKYIYDCAIFSQGFELSKTKLLSSSYYRRDLLPRSHTIKRQKFGFACMGPHMNRDEANFIKELDKLSKCLKFDFTVIQHPHFKHNFSHTEFEALKFISFDYANYKLHDFYLELSSYSLIIGSGTTLLLDAAFVGVPIAATMFEVCQQPFWISHLRSFDYIPHTRDFFQNRDIQKLYSMDDLKEYLQDFSDTHKQMSVDESHLMHFLGNWDLIFPDILFNEFLSNPALHSALSTKK